ncbi:hypothetical protein FQR65_LT06471 [Abscondita terminalis]|nr:hypothetical protein FQR65_LT06471 [Abscondita terminalis]
MESKSNIDKLTPGKPRHNILLERNGQTKYYSFNSDSPFRLLPSISTPPPRIFKVNNPFESHLTERLHRPMFSPSVFNVQSVKTDDKFKWTIEDISLLKPADIDEGNVEQFECNEHDSEIESTAQARIESYFSEKHIVPSPFDVAVNNAPLLSESGDKQKSFKEFVDGTAQTILTLPPILPEQLEAVLKPYFSYHADQQQDENGRNSLYRKLFDCGYEHSSESVLTSPAQSCALSPIELSPYLEAKRQSIGSFGSPNNNQMSECNLSPITSNVREARSNSVRLHFSSRMSIDTSSNMVPDALDQIPSNNQKSMHSPSQEVLSNSEVNWDIEYNHVSLATSKDESSDNEMDVSNSNTPKSKIFMSQRKKLSDSFLQTVGRDEDKENIFNFNNYERRNNKLRLRNDTTDVGYHTGLHTTEESWSSTHLYASTPTKSNKIEMDRNKGSSSSRGSKSKVTQQPPDTFIALGAKPSSSRDDSKRSTSLSKPSTSHLQSSSSKSLPERKREASSSNLQASSSTSKKIKSSISGRSPGIGSSSTSHTTSERANAAIEPWESLALECESTELFDTVITIANAGSTDKAVSFILGAIKAFKGQRFKPCKILYNAILLICQCKPSLFTNENVVNAVVSSIRREIAAGFKSPNKGNIYTQILLINVMVHAFGDVLQWPEAFVKLYVEDALGDRTWIDNPYCKPFVDNIITAFNTKQPPKVLFTSETWLSTGRDTSSPLTVNSLEDDEAFNDHKILVDSWKVKVFSRYSQLQEMVEKISLEAIQEQIARRQQPEAVTKNFVRFLSTACGLVEIRMLAVSRLESWLHNHKLMKPAQELLAYVCYNCSARTQRDIEVVAQLSKLRLKSKPLVNIFNNCLKEMVLCFPENLFPLLKYTIYNELSNARNTNNLVVVGAMFQVTPEASADAFAEICLVRSLIALTANFMSLFQELLLNKDDYLRSLRALLKEINRVLRHDFNLLSIAHALLRERLEISNVVREFEFKDRMFFALADLVCMCMLLCVSPQVRDAATQNKRDVSVLQAFQLQVSNIQREAIIWLHDSAVRVFRPSPADFLHILHKVIFLAQAEEYYKVDSWPGENERNLFLRMASEVPILQATLLRILLIGLSKEHPIGQSDVIEILDQFVKRAANLAPDCMPPLVMDKIEIVDLFFNLCSYNYPENIILPPGYIPPNLAIASLYWKTWLILLILAAHNPTTFGSLAWNKYPTLRTLMEMCITNHFSFPPPTMTSGGDNIDDYSSKELQNTALERQKIIEFESHLAAASTKVEITEQTSLLLSQLMELKPQGDARKPPPTVLDQLRILNTTHRLGHLLCRSRNPDFLLDIMSRQGGTAHMPWLAELVHSSEGAFAHLPVQCLCEYLLSTIPTEKLTKHGQLLTHLRTVVNGSDPQNACEVLEYLLRRLTSIHAASRTQAIKGLALVLSPNEDIEISNVNVDTQWLTQFIPLFPHMAAVRPILVQFLRQALFVETNPIHVSNYVTFLSTQDLEESLPDLLELVLDLASIIVERSCITSHILPGENMHTLTSLIAIFCLYLQRARQPTDETFHWSESQDQVVVTWANGEQCTLQILIVHASIILLTYGPLPNFEYFDTLTDTWFPKNEEHPKAYLVDTSEEALLVPDWLKLRMIRSNVPRLVDAAVEKLEAPQLVLFIQSFGIPVVSISKLLQALDKVTLMDEKLVVDSVLDKNYMIQLVEVQNRRGAKGGETFVRSLELQGPPVQDDEEMNVLTRKKILPVLRKNESDFSVDFDVNNLPNLLNNIFNANYKGDKTKDFNCLIKAVSLNVKAKKFVLRYLKGAPSELIHSLLNTPRFAIAFCKILFSKNDCNDIAIPTAKNLLSNVTDLTHSIAQILRKFLDESDPKDGTIKPHASKDKSSVALLGVTPKISDVIKDSNSENVGEKLGRLLMANDLETEKTGLIVDWLCMVELEILTPNKSDVQIDLLFSRQNLPFRPLLISLLLQRGSWSTLYGIVKHLLQSNNRKYCPNSTLDFLTALTQSPRLWQGRDKAVPKHFHSEDVLHLNVEEVVALVNYIIDESEMNEENWDKRMESRLPLLINSIGNQSEPVVVGLLEKSQTGVKCRELLLMLYMSVPSIGKHLINFNKHRFAQILYTKTSSSVVDVVSHTLLSALAATSRSKDWPRKSQDLDLCARKLAATHPELVLRQLPMLAGSLRGRAQYEYPVLKSRGHLLLFGQILGILELLQPIVFDQKESLCSILDSFFLLLQYHGHVKEITFILNRIVTLLQNWMTKDVKSALKYLQKHGQLLNELQLSQPSVRPLLSSVSLPVQDQNAPSELLVGTATPPTPEPLPQQWPALLASLQSQDVLPGLQELDHLTSKKPQLLQHVAQHLYVCLDSSSNNVRSLSLLLVVRLLRYNPKESEEVLPTILMCLNSNNPDVVASILDRLPELVTTMQEHAKVILTRVFQLAVNSNVNAIPSLTKSISLLNLQYGC